MLWSLTKILLFFAVVAGLTYGAVELMALPGSAEINAFGVSIELSLLEILVGLLVFLVLAWLFFRLLGLLVATFRFLNGDETAVSRYFNRNRERRGFEALSDGLVALASGEGHLALTKAVRAEKYLQRPELTNVLIAQAAELSGDKRKAEQTYRKLLEDDRTRFVGVRGLMKKKLSDGDTETALKLAEKAFSLKPKHIETQDVLLDLQTGKGDWAGARRTLGAKLRNGALPRDVHKRRDAVLALSEAKAIIDDDSTIDAREKAIEANKLSPDLVPAAVLAAKGYIEAGNKRYASRVLTTAWKAQPHPDIAATFAEIEPNEDAKARLKRFRALTKVKADSSETRMLLAELQIAAEDFPAARKALGDLHETDPTARSLALMAATERGMGASEDVVRGWLAKAVAAPRGPQWVCKNCQSIHAEWQPICKSCSALDTLDWVRPPESEAGLGGAEMLPLLVDAPNEEQPVEDAELVEKTSAPTDPASSETSEFKPKN